MKRVTYIGMAKSYITEKFSFTARKSFNDMTESEAKMFENRPTEFLVEDSPKYAVEKPTMNPKAEEVKKDESIEEDAKDIPEESEDDSEEVVEEEVVEEEVKPKKAKIKVKKK